MKRRNNAILATVMLLAPVYLAHVARAGSCGSAKLCCQGRDSGCVIQKESPNAIIFSPRDKPCYCDHACLKLADCCDDFKETCGVVDCVVSEWSLWTPCDNGCGSGAQRRTRVVEMPDKNGGKHCPRLDQARTCRSYQNCHVGGHALLHDKSVAIIALFPDRDNVSQSRKEEEQSPNCVAFSIVRASRACNKVSSTLNEGSWICVERHENEILDKLVGIGHWRLTGGTSAIAVNTSCHGKWIGDSRVLVDCDDDRCKQAARVQHLAELFPRVRRSVMMGSATRTARVGSRTQHGRTIRRRRKGRRRNDSKRKRGEMEYE